jgi:uncharacterized protein
VTHILSLLPTSTLPSPAPSTIGPSTSSQAQPPTAYINLANSFGNTALHWACLGGHLDTIKLLMSRGASPALANDKDQIPLDLAAFNNHMDVVEYFLSQSRQQEEANAQEGGLEGAAAEVKMEEVDEEEDMEEAEGSGAKAGNQS